MLSRGYIVEGKFVLSPAQGPERHHHIYVQMLLTVIFISFVLIVVGTTKAAEIGDLVKNVYTAENGKKCYKCRPGYYKLNDCKESYSNARCVVCPVGSFQSSFNEAASCAPCKRHCYGHHQETVEACSSIHDMLCFCIEMYYYHSTGLDEGHCLPLSKCPPGKGVIKNGTRTNNTKCSSCKSGYTYSGEKGLQACKPCAPCADGMKQVTPCNVTHNTVCAHSQSVNNSPTPDRIQTVSNSSTPDRMQTTTNTDEKTIIVVRVLVILLVLFALVFGVALVFLLRKKCTDQHVMQGTRAKIVQTGRNNNMYVFSNEDPQVQIINANNVQTGTKSRMTVPPNEENDGDATNI